MVHRLYSIGIHHRIVIPNWDDGCYFFYTFEEYDTCIIKSYAYAHFDTAFELFAYGKKKPLDVSGEFKWLIRFLWTLLNIEQTQTCVNWFIDSTHIFHRQFMYTYCINRVKKMHLNIVTKLRTSHYYVLYT